MTHLETILPILLGAAWLLPLGSFALIVLFGPRMGRAGRCAGYLATICACIESTLVKRVKFIRGCAIRILAFQAPVFIQYFPDPFHISGTNCLAHPRHECFNAVEQLLF